MPCATMSPRIMPFATARPASIWIPMLKSRRTLIAPSVDTAKWSPRTAARQVTQSAANQGTLLWPLRKERFSIARTNIFGVFVNIEQAVLPH